MTARCSAPAPFLPAVVALLVATLLLVTGADQRASAQAPSPETQAIGKAWDAAYLDPSAGAFSAEPNAFLMDVARDMTPGTALDVGMGQGRNALYLATLGWTVTGFDPSAVGVRQAREAAAKAGLTLTALVQRSQEFEWGTDRWDLIVLTYFPGVRQHVAQIVQSLRPGGAVVVEGYHTDAARDRPPGPGPGVSYEDNELLRLFPTLRVVRYEDARGRADWGMFETRLVRLLAQKRSGEN